MIKINLLESVTDRPAGVAFVEDRVSSTRTQTFLLALTVGALLVLGMGFDYVSANAAHDTATRELEKERRINEQMNAVKREKFIFDLLPKARRSLVLETSRELEFAPIKNQSGPDSLQTSLAQYRRVRARWKKLRAQRLR